MSLSPAFNYHNEPGYLQALEDILRTGAFRKPADEEGRKEIFTIPLTFDTRGGVLPLMTTKKVWFKGLATELLWFISGEISNGVLKRYGNHIWDPWTASNGSYIGPMYGFMWRKWNGLDVEYIDQLQACINSLHSRPEARSHLVTAWDPSLLSAQPIKPCHVMFQFHRDGIDLQLTLFQRSCDMFLGVPFNIAQYSLLGHIVADLLTRTGAPCNLVRFNWIGADCHIYDNHFAQVEEQIRRKPERFPLLDINPSRQPKTIDDYKFADFRLLNYSPHPALRGEVSVQGKGHQEESSK